MPEQRATMNGKPTFTVPSKTIINFESGFAKKLLCDGPTFTAGTSCPYSCSFCYVPSAMKKQEPWLAKHGVTGKHEDIVIRRANPVEIARKQLLSHPEAERQKRKVIYASPLTDVAANMELVRETVELCKLILTLTNWDIRLLSKSNLLPKVAREIQYACWNNDTYGGTEFTNGFKAVKRIIFGVSTGTLDDKIAAAFEEGTPKVSKRIESLHWLQDNGFRTFGMICPSLPQSDYKKFAGDMHAALRADRCEHVWAEVINVRGDSFTNTEKRLREAGYELDADCLKLVSTDKPSWERYARDTFEAHVPLYKPGKLRFLQYVDKSNERYWKGANTIIAGAVIL